MRGEEQSPLRAALTPGHADVEQEALEALTERLDLIRHKLKFIETKPDVIVIEQIRPLMVAGHWVPELVEIAGGRPVLAKHGERSPLIDYGLLKAANPDIIMITPRCFSIQRTLQEIGSLTALEGWVELKAVKNSRVYVADGNQYFNGPGARIVDSAEVLAEIIHPKQFVFGYEGKGWVKFD